MNHIIAISGGKDSTAMALQLKQVEQNDYQYVITPTGDELPEMKKHWETLEKRLTVSLRVVSPGYSFSDLINKMSALPNFRMRFCTRMLKIIPFQSYIMNHLPCTIYVGLRADEEGRAGVEWDDSQITVRYPLREWNWGIDEVLKYLDSVNIQIPKRTDCARCFYQTLYEWYMLWKEYPDIYASAVLDEKKIGHTYRSPSRDTHPAELELLAKEFENGYIPKIRQRKLRCRIFSL
jgi:hypothetical protein